MEFFCHRPPMHIPHRPSLAEAKTERERRAKERKEREKKEKGLPGRGAKRPGAPDFRTFSSSTQWGRVPPKPAYVHC